MRSIMADNRSSGDNLARAIEKSLAVFREKMPNHYQTIQTWPLNRALPEILRELRKAD